jgi:hypothetical protein
MRCKCCDTLLTEWESKARDPSDRKQFLDLCGVCRYHSNPYSFLDDDEVINKEDLSIDSSS